MIIDTLSYDSRKKILAIGLVARLTVEISTHVQTYFAIEIIPLIKPNYNLGNLLKTCHFKDFNHRKSDTSINSFAVMYSPFNRNCISYR